MSKKITIRTKDKQILASGEIGNNILLVEGNYYFDKSTVIWEFIKMREQGKQYTCPIKLGTCDYYNLVDESGKILTTDIGWVYEKVDNSLFDAIAGKIAFDTRGKDLNIEII